MCLGNISRKGGILFFLMLHCIVSLPLFLDKINRQKALSWNLSAL